MGDFISYKMFDRVINILYGLIQKLTTYCNNVKNFSLFKIWQYIGEEES